MKPKAGKAKSKRRTLKDKYKIERKVREHHRKQRKEERLKGKGGLKKDPGIPNLHPFKEAILAKVTAAKERVEEDKQRRKDARKESHAARRQALMEGATSLEQLQADADARAGVYEAMEEQVAAAGGGGAAANGVNETSRRSFFKEFRKVVDAADVILEVLDARNPLGCRSQEVEQAVMAAGPRKKLVLVLNKIDLVPREVVEDWLKYLRNEYPTVAFKAATQSQRSHIGHSRGEAVGGDSGSAAQGADVLLRLFGNYCRSQDIRTSIRVGIVGYPNVGKSSIINSLKRSKVCGVGAMPGFTKTNQEVSLDKHVKLIDSPGIVMARGSDVELVLRNCVKLETIQDPVAPVDAILQRCSHEQVMERYAVPAFDHTMTFLQHLARRLGRIGKGGRPDINSAARVVLQDWNNGRISYFTRPPEGHSRKAHLSAEVVQEWSQAFDMASLMKTEQDHVLPSLRPEEEHDGLVAMTAPMMVEPTVERLDSESEGEGEGEGGQMDQGEEVVTMTYKPMGRVVREQAAAADTGRRTKASLLDEIEQRENPRSNAALKKLRKQQKRDKRRSAAAVPAEAMMEEAEEAEGPVDVGALASEAYSFDDAFGQGAFGGAAEPDSADELDL